MTDSNEIDRLTMHAFGGREARELQTRADSVQLTKSGRQALATLTGPIHHANFPGPLRPGGFAYLASLMDLCSRRVFGWSIDKQMTDSLVIDALQKAVATRQPPPSLIHHSDRGGQYASHDDRAILRRAGCQQSMSRAANCYDNAFMESCFGCI